MHAVATRLSEHDFAALVDALAADPARRDQLTDLMREDHPFYDQRGAAAIVRMRGWVLLAIGKAGVSDAALIFLLEELDAGVDPYLVAAAARALRAGARPAAALAPFVARALANIRYRDESVSFERYGEYAVLSAHTSPVRELLATLAWLGPHARSVLPELEAMRRESGAFVKRFRLDLDRALHAIGSVEQADDAGDCCAGPPVVAGSQEVRAADSRAEVRSVESVMFEDHAGTAITYRDFFCRAPSIVVFFYTRCDNPLKCSLTVTRLAQLQQLLEAEGLADRVQTAAITYDPAFDIAQRLRVYGQDRGVRLDERHRMLRAIRGEEVMRRHFELGVNFVGSLVNRHRIEAYVLDARGRIAASFERIRWDEHQIVACVRDVLLERA